MKQVKKKNKPKPNKNQMNNNRKWPRNALWLLLNVIYRSSISNWKHWIYIKTRSEALALLNQRNSKIDFKKKKKKLFLNWTENKWWPCFFLTSSYAGTQLTHLIQNTVHYRCHCTLSWISCMSLVKKSFFFTGASAWNWNKDKQKCCTLELSLKINFQCYCIFFSETY